MAPPPEQLNTYGTMIAASQFWGAILGTALLAVQVFMVLYGLTVFSGLSKNERKGRLRYIIISLAILVTSCIDTTIDIWQCYRILYAGGPTGESYINAYRQYYTGDEKAILAGDTMLVIVVGMCDALMLWRCLILWAHKKWIVVVPCLTCLGAIGSTVAGLVLTWTDTQTIFKAQVVSVSLSVATNIMTTCLILCRLGMAWLERRKTFPGQTSPHMYSDVAVIMIESATPLAFFGICLIATIATSQLYPHKSFPERARISIAGNYLNWLYYLFCALSPQMIIFRVTMGKSWKDASESRNGVATFSQPIQFARDAEVKSRSSNLTESA